MVPTSVERLREGQGVLERVLRGGIKVDRILKKTDGDKEAGKPRPCSLFCLFPLCVAWLSLKSPWLTDGYEQQGPRGSPSRSPAHYSPSVFSQQVSLHLPPCLFLMAEDDLTSG